MDTGKRNEVTRTGDNWQATILHRCGHDSDFVRAVTTHNNGDGCTIGKARHIVRAEAGMVCPACRTR